MSSPAAENKRDGTRGPTSACMIRYLEGLANRVRVSQLEEPSSSTVLASTYSSPGNNPVETNVVLNTLDKYFVRK